MAYNVSRQVSPSLAVCSLSSAGAGLATISYINGDFAPSISGTTLTLGAGYEYFLVTSPVTNAHTGGYYETRLNGVSQGSYSISATDGGSGLDEKFDSVLASSAISFEVYSTHALGSNSRLQVWRLPL